jgi:hypothetical protein
MFDVQVGTSDDNGSAVSSPQAVASVAAPSFLQTATPPIVFLLQPT